MGIGEEGGWGDGGVEGWGWGVVKKRRGWGGKGHPLTNSLQRAGKAVELD